MLGALERASVNPEHEVGFEGGDSREEACLWHVDNLGLTLSALEAH